MGVTAAWVAAATTAASVVSQADTARKNRHAQTDLLNAQAAQQKDAETKATQTANERLAMRRRALASQSLATGGGDTGMAASGKPTLGG